MRVSQRKLIRSVPYKVVFYPGDILPSLQLYPNSIHITAVLVEYTTRVGRKAKGVATSWLQDKIPNGPDNVPRVPIYVRKSQFRLPFRPSTPVIMVGPGTGLAPFRGFIQERHHAKEDGGSKKMLP